MLISASEEYIDELITERNAIRNQRDELLAHVERLRDELFKVRDQIAGSDVDCLGVGETSQGDTYPISGEVIYAITKCMNATPAQSLAAVRAEAVEKAADNLCRFGRMYHDTDYGELMDYAHQLKTIGEL